MNDNFCYRRLEEEWLYEGAIKKRSILRYINIGKKKDWILHQKSFNFLGAPILFSLTVVIINDMSGCLKSLKGVSVRIDDCLLWFKSSGGVSIGIDEYFSYIKSTEGVSVGLDESFW